MSIKPTCPHCGIKHRSTSARMACAVKKRWRKTKGEIIEMEQCPVCEAYQEEPADHACFSCVSCGVVAI